MSKRIKYVVNSDEVCHRWAHQTQDSARTPGRPVRMYFEGDKIYSYGPHFCIARLIPHPRYQASTPLGMDTETVVLFTVREYGITTAKHKSQVLRAVSHIDTKFRVLYPEKGVSQADVDYWHEKAKTSFEKAMHCVMGNMSRHVRYANDCQYRAQELVSNFGDNGTLVMPPSVSEIRARVDARYTRLSNDPKRKEKAAKALAARERQERELKARLDALQVKYQARVIANWRACVSETQGFTDEERSEMRAAGLTYASYLMPRDKQFTRLVNPETVQTSMGATVPVEHARKAIGFIKALVARGEVINSPDGSVIPCYLYKRNGHTLHIGSYPLDYVLPNSDIKVGCHYFEYAEILDLEQRLNALPISTVEKGEA